MKLAEYLRQTGAAFQVSPAHGHKWNDWYGDTKTYIVLGEPLQSHNWALYHLSDYRVSSTTSGPRFVLVPR